MSEARRVRIQDAEPNANPTRSDEARPTDRRRWPAFIVPLIYAMLLSPIAARDVLNAHGRASFDQVLFHEHTIDAIARTWPLFTLTSAEKTTPDHYVAMTPGFHWVLAGVARLTGVGDSGLRLVALGMSAGIFSLLGYLLGRRCGAACGALLIAPMMASVYIMNSGAWLLADNAGWMWVGLLGIAAVFCRPSPGWALLMGVGLLLAVWTRQNLLFLAMPLWAAAWLRSSPEGPTSFNPLVSVPTRVKNLLPMAVATLPAIASLIYLYSIWGGLVPYEFQGQYNGAGPSNLALQLVMLAGLGVFFLPILLGVGEAGWRERVSPKLRQAVPWMLLAALLAGGVAVVVPTTPDPKAGRAGLIWSIAQTVNPIGSIGHCNPIVVLGAMAGGVTLVIILAMAPPRRRWILAALFTGFGIAQAASSEVWQRYHEPFAMLFLALATSVAVAHRAPGWRRPPLPQLGMISVLALGLAVTSAVVLWTREVNPWRQGASRTPTAPMLPEPPSEPPDRGVNPSE